MCPECEAEYRDPENRRFHAQPNACPVCGPRVESRKRGNGEAGKGRVSVKGNGVDIGEAGLREAVVAIRRGEIVAVKGLGGFHLMVDARNEPGVQRLRERKRREEKPLAVMVPSLAIARELCEISDAEERLLTSAESPIVILKRREGGLEHGDKLKFVQQSAIPARRNGSMQAGGYNPQFAIAPSVSPSNPTLGLMLPYTPLHHLLMYELGFPVVATSGNLSDEPICIDEQEAFERLGGIADLFLVHDRPIVRHVDDSVVRIVAGRELVLRRARGYAPLPIPFPIAEDHEPVLAVGAHLKNAVTLVSGGNAFISQHIGDLETAESLNAFRRVTHDLQSLFDAPATIVACDLHPDYIATKEARMMHDAPIAIQHHHAHILSCMAENDLRGEVLGVAWDGTGYGEDGTIWGGEFLRVGPHGFERIAHVRTFPLPGGDAAVKEPRRSAVGMLSQLGIRSWEGGVAGDQVKSHKSKVKRKDDELLFQMIEKGVNAPWTSSVGRLFDAVAALAGLRQTVRHEGQAAMELEYRALECPPTRAWESAPYALTMDESRTPIVLDWEPMIRQILSDTEAGISLPEIALKFHWALAESIVAAARKIRLERVALSGGCFQNALLTERTISRLREEGFRPYWHQRVPPNDGGIALGQAYGAILRQKRLDG